MPDDQQFGIFIDDGQGPMWRAFVTTLEEAKFQAQRLADAEGCEFFIYDFNGFSEIARMFPSSDKAQA